MAERKNEAQWMENQNRWQIKVQHDGERRAFHSKTPGRKGKIEAERRPTPWASGLSNTNLRLGAAWDAWVTRRRSCAEEEHRRRARGTGASASNRFSEINKKFSSSVTPQDWQDCIVHAFRVTESVSQETLQVRHGNDLRLLEVSEALRIPFDAPEDPLVIPRQAKNRLAHHRCSRRICGKVFPSTVTGSRAILQPHYLFASGGSRLATGLRPGDSICLQKSDIREPDTIKIHHTKNRGKKQNEKQRATRRSCLPPRAADAPPTEQKNTQRSGELPPPLSLGEEGGPASERNVYKTWRRYCVKLGIPPTLAV